MCMKRRLLPDGVCGEMVKRKTVEKDFEDDFEADSIRFKGKALRKLWRQGNLLNICLKKLKKLSYS